MRAADIALDGCQSPTTKELVEFTLRAGTSTRHGRIYSKFKQQGGVSETGDSLLELAVFGNTVALTAWRERPDRKRARDQAA